MTLRCQSCAEVERLRARVGWLDHLDTPEGRAMHATEAVRVENEELRRRIDLLLRPRARRSDPDTSHDAANSLVKPLAMNARRGAVLAVLSECGPMVDASLVSAYERRAQLGHVPQQTPQGIRSRRSELVRMGLVAAGGKRKVGRHLHTIWRARP